MQIITTLVTLPFNYLETNLNAKLPQNYNLKEKKLIEK